MASQKAIKKYPKIDAWSGYADTQAWGRIGSDLKAKVVKVLGENRAINTQFGNVLGWLRDMGESGLASQLRNAIDEHNAMQEERRSNFDLR